MIKQPREYAQKIIKRLPGDVNKMLDEDKCPEDMRDMVKDYVYFGLAKAWSKRNER